MDELRWVTLRAGEAVAPQLLAASRARRGLRCAGAEVDAGEFRAACLAAGEADPYGLRLGGARVTGRLDLRACDVPVPLRFTSGEFTDPVNVQGASLHDLVIRGDAATGRRSALPGLLAAGARIKRDLVLSGMTVTGSLPARAESRSSASVWITEAEIGGSVFLLASPETRQRCRVRGRIELSHATVRGDLFIRDADLTAPPAGGGVHFYNVASSTARVLLLAPRLTLTGALQIEGETVLRGGIHLPGAQLGAGLRLSGALWSPADTALDLSQSTLGGGVEAAGASIEGTMNLRNAQVEGPLVLERAVLGKPRDRVCLSAVNLRVTGDVLLGGLAAVGGCLNFRGASITGAFDAEDAYVSNPGDRTISLHRAYVTGNVRLCGSFRSSGQVVLNRAVIEGRLRADGATLAWRRPAAPADPPGRENERDTAFEAVFADFRGGIGLGWNVVAGTVDLTGATTTYLADRPERDWPAGSHVGGFAYARFEAVGSRGGAVWGPAARIAWLSRMGTHDPRAWEHLAAVLRTAGDRDGAEAVLVAQLRRARPFRTAPRRFFDFLQDVTVRYGFRPQRAVYLLLALIAAVTVALYLPGVQDRMRATDQNALVFSPAGAHPLPGEANPSGECGNGKVRCLSPFFYAVDTVVPLIDLHQRSTWYPVDERDGPLLGWALNLCTILGWAASTVFALSFTRLGRAS